MSQCVCRTVIALHAVLAYTVHSKTLRGQHVRSVSCGTDLLPATAMMRLRNETIAVAGVGGDWGVSTYFSAVEGSCVLKLQEIRRVANAAVNELRHQLEEFGPNVSVRTNAPVDLSELQAGFTPKTIVVGGLPRTGSTSLTVIAQLWLVLADASYDPTMVEPWIDFEREEDFINAKKENRSRLLKVHRIDKWLTNIDDGATILMSHRHPLDQLASEEFSFAETCDTLIQLQVDMYQEASRCCGGVAYDMQLEDLVSAPLDVLKGVAVSIGITESALAPHILSYAQRVFMDDLPSSEDAGLPKSIQAWHSDEERAAVISDVKERALKSEACREWINNEGRYPHAA